MNYLFETSRLRFRDMLVADAEILFELNSDPEVIRYTDDPPFNSLEKTRIFIEERLAAYAKAGYGRWIAELKENKEVIGWCGLKFVEEKKETDVGYRFFRKFWGKGYGTESCGAALEYGFEKLGVKKIFAEARKENAASIRIMEKCGMKFLRESKGCEGETVIYEKFG
ncbi:MAG: GNAT family N-acetyltransferase [Bacteroidetes bacterium]|nr:GNAT family N-acetyltransferase [Bacteroidota bacterium]